MFVEGSTIVLALVEEVLVPSSAAAAFALTFEGFSYPIVIAKAAVAFEAFQGHCCRKLVVIPFWVALSLENLCE